LLKTEIVLSNFKESKCIKHFSQKQLNKLFTKFVASAICIKNEVHDQNKANQILLETHEKMQQYALKEKYISKNILVTEKLSYWMKNILSKKMVS